MKYHPYSEIFPLIEGAEFDALVEDIKAHGLREKIWLYDGKILDGRNRFLACKKASVTPQFRKYAGKDALAFVVSANMQRRHLTVEQRALAAAKISNLNKGRPSENAPRGAFSQTEAAEAFGVGRRSVQRATKVVEQGSKALLEAVAAGEVPLTKAAAVVDLPKSEQLKAAQKADPDEPPRDDSIEPDEEQKRAAVEREIAESIDKVMRADDKLAAAHAEIKRQAAEIAVLKLSRDGYMNGKAAVTKLLKAEQRKTERLERDGAKLKDEMEKLRERIAIMEAA